MDEERQEDGYKQVSCYYFYDTETKGGIYDMMRRWS